MFLLLLMLLVFALIITMLGFFLSTKSKNHDQQPEYAIARRSSRVIPSTPMRRERMLEPVSSRNRGIEPIPLVGRSIVDAIPSGRRSIDRPMPIARRRAATPVRLRGDGRRPVALVCRRR